MSILLQQYRTNPNASRASLHEEPIYDLIGHVIYEFQLINWHPTSYDYHYDC
jgi:hypothetical protein